MFTGVVEEIGRVTSAQPGKLVIFARDVIQRIERGGSIAVNGVCLTITSFPDWAEVTLPTSSTIPVNILTP